MTQPIRQTISYIKNILAIYAIDPKNKLGQNFLIDLNTLDLVIAAGNLSKQDAVLEIGPGTGTLTHNLVEQAGYVLSVEIDSRFEPILKELVPSESPLNFTWRFSCLQKPLRYPSFGQIKSRGGKVWLHPIQIGGEPALLHCHARNHQPFNE